MYDIKDSVIENETMIKLLHELSETWQLDDMHTI